MVEVLIVDDEATIREMLSVHFDLAKYKFREAENGEEALELLNDHVSDVVVLDVMMPVMDGLETCRRIREKPRTALSYVIMLTARAEETDKVVGLSMGADDYLTKPFSRRELEARIHNLLTNKIARDNYEQEETPAIWINTGIKKTCQIPLERYFLQVQKESSVDTERVTLRK